VPIYALCYGVVQPSTGRAGILCRLQKVRNARANSVRAKFEGKITQTLVDSVVHIPEGESEVIYSDGVVPGYRLHVGKKVRSFELRIERKPKANIHIGDTLGVTADEARTKAWELITRHRRGLPLVEVVIPAVAAVTIDSTWEWHEAYLRKRGKRIKTTTNTVNTGANAATTDALVGQLAGPG
jgi:hypothetical protein